MAKKPAHRAPGAPSRGASGVDPHSPRGSRRSHDPHAHEGENASPRRETSRGPGGAPDAHPRRGGNPEGKGTPRNDERRSPQPEGSRLARTGAEQPFRFPERSTTRKGALQVEAPRGPVPTDCLTAALPMTREEMRARGWEHLDILLVSGDAYVDHPSFGIALLGRWLVAHGFRVGVVAQPRWEDPQAALEDISVMGRPLLFAGVSAGAIDSMLAHYTAFRKKRHDDAYTPGGKDGARPNRAAIMYTGLVRRAFSGLPVVLGGIEASLRRIAHYDFWVDALRRPLLFDSKADLLVYGMGERSLLAIAEHARSLHEANPDWTRADLVRAVQGVPGLAYVAGKHALPPVDASLTASKGTAGSGAASAGYAVSGSGTLVELPSYEAILAEPPLLMQATLALEQHVHSGSSPFMQRVEDRAVVVNPPAPPLTEAELDTLYALPFSRLPHPSYRLPIPAWEMIRTSITTHRGCGGGCSFCSLALHQGRRIASRSKSSILAEAEAIAGGGTGGPAPKWAGSISDVGGPSANMWQAACTLRDKVCRRASCLHPAVCPFFQVDQRKGAALLREISRSPGVRHVRIASGVRFDLALLDEDALVAYTAEFTGGQLKVAPEHSEDVVLDLMRKPSLPVFERFLASFARHSKGAGKEQYTVPYLMSAFPGCTLEHMHNLAAWLREKHWQPQQVQCFIPTPGTVATAMFYAGVDDHMQPLYVARTDKERMEQHHALFGDMPRHGGGHGSRPPQEKRTTTPPASRRKSSGFSRRG